MNHKLKIEKVKGKDGKQRKRSKLYHIEVDDYVIYQKTYFIFASNRTQAKKKLDAGDYSDMSASERGETTDGKRKIVSIHEVSTLAGCESVAASKAREAYKNN